MLLSEVRISNFGPFYDKASIQFGSGDRPLVVVHGDNELGKTSILNAIRWGFYGVALDRFRKAFPLVLLLNDRRREEGVFEISVEIDFADGSATYRLTRLARARNNPRQDEDFLVSVYLRRNGVQLTREEADAEIGRIFPEETSRFFLFDGEQLNEYETLVANPTTQVAQIKKSIENILGVPALTNTVIDVEIRRKDAARRQRLRAASVAKAEATASLASVVAKEIEVLEADVAKMTERRTQLDAEVHRLQTELGREEPTARLIENLERLNRQMADDAIEQEQLLTERRPLVGRAWLDFVQPRVAARLANLEAQRESEESSLDRYTQLVARRDQLERAIQGEVCSLCGQSLDRAHIQSLKGDLGKVVSGIDNLEIRPDHRGETTSSIKRLRQLPPGGTADRLRAIEERLAGLRVRRLGAQQQVVDIRDKLGTSDVDAIRERGRLLRQLAEEFGQLQLKLGDQEKALNEKRSQLAALEAKWKDLDDPELKRLNREVALYQGLFEAFTHAIDKLRDALRQTIEADASEIFRQLTANPNYKGLRINENYGLTIISKADSEISVRSAGAEQIVALALIGALNRNAAIRGPVVMDTPLARLDLRHRANVLKFLPTMSEQTMLLVQPGEVDPARGVDVIRGLVDREYLLKSVGLGQTEVVPLHAEAAA